MSEAVYGLPPAALATPAAGAAQTSPLIPGSDRIEELADGTLDAFTVLAPPGVIERRYVLAQGLRALKPGARLLALAPKDKGGSRLGKELEAFGCAVEETGKRHHRICRVERPASPVGLDAAIADGGPQPVESLGLWSQPGVFSWNRLDPGTALLLKTLPALSGQGADFGCGIGVLSRAVLSSPTVKSLTLIDLDRRATDAAARNIDAPRARIVWSDVRTEPLADLDFVVMNPPFHDGGAEDKALGQAFLRQAAASLRKGGRCWVVANRHLPYEAVLSEHFTGAALKADAGGYKVYEARK